MTTTPADVRILVMGAINHDDIARVQVAPRPARRSSRHSANPAWMSRSCAE